MPLAAITRPIMMPTRSAQTTVRVADGPDRARELCVLFIAEWRPGSSGRGLRAVGSGRCAAQEMKAQQLQQQIGALHLSCPMLEARYSIPLYHDRDITIDGVDVEHDIVA